MQLDQIHRLSQVGSSFYDIRTGWRHEVELLDLWGLEAVAADTVFPPGVHPSSHGPDPTALWGTAIAQGGKVSCHYTFPRGRTEEQRHVLFTGDVVLNSEGAALLCTTTHLDVTDTYQAHAAAARAAAANAAKSEFLSTTSHELRTPLNSILGFTQLLELDELTTDQLDAVGHILHGGKHLLGLLNDLLDIALIEGSRSEVRVEPLGLEQVVAEAVEMMAPIAVAAGVELIYHLDGGKGVQVIGDRRRLRQVALNLLSNAIKYNRPGGSVEVRYDATDSQWLDVMVADTGPGIKPADLPRLFVPFDRLDAKSSSVEGTGIGLALSDRLMQAQHGALRVHSEVGVGSTFTMSIPVARTDTRPG